MEEHLEKETQEPDLHEILHHLHEENSHINYWLYSVLEFLEQNNSLFTVLGSLAKKSRIAELIYWWEETKEQGGVPDPNYEESSEEEMNEVIKKAIEESESKDDLYENN